MTKGLAAALALIVELNLKAGNKSQDYQKALDDVARGLRKLHNEYRIHNPL